MTRVRIRHFTDPACPFAFSAEPRLRRLEWLYGDRLEWDTRMVVLSESPDEYEERGFTVDMQAAGLKAMYEAHGMPIDWRRRERMPATVEACRRVVAARLHAPEAEARLLRRFRVLAMGGGLLDDPALLDRAASDAGIDPGVLEGWLEDPAVEEALDADKGVARHPAPAALALDHKLADADDGRRYTCPSLELTADEELLVLPGFQPLEAYEVALANLAPGLERREDPESVEEVLEWAPFPLATAEIAAVCARSEGDVRSELARVAEFEPVGGDGYWSPRAVSGG